MLRKLFSAVVVLSLMPALANAWTIAAKIGSGSGTIISGAQQITKGTGYITVPGGSAGAVAVQAAPGWALSMVVLDGTQVTHADPLYSIASIGNRNRTLIAYFTPLTRSVTLSQSTGGSVSAQLTAPTVGAVSMSGVSGVPDGGTVKIVAAPNIDYQVTSIQVDGVTVWRGSSYDAAVHNLSLNGSKHVAATFSKILSIRGWVTADSTSVAVNQNVQIDASSSTTNDPPLSYGFAVTSGEPGRVTLTGSASSPKATFAAAAPGSYAVTVTVTSAHGAKATATCATIKVLDSGVFGSQICTACHGGRNRALVASYLASAHAVLPGAPSCSGCHNPQNIGHYTVERPVDSCRDCHLKSGGVPRHPVEIGDHVCLDCHDPHNPTGSASATASHFNNMTGAGYPASYVTSRSTCSDCHYNTPQNATVRGEWAVSGHSDTKDAPWMKYDFKTLSGCVQCHSTTGFIAYSSGKVTAAWGASSDKTKEVLACNACHSDVPKGTVRTVALVKPFPSSHYLNHDAATSNVCYACHGGVNNGDSIASLVGSADLTNTPFIAPHYLAAAATLQGVAGYHFPGRSYALYSSNSHREIGMGNKAATGTAGPCVACHMSAEKRHLFQVTTTDSNGAINGITSPVCANCHAASLGVNELGADRSEFRNALLVLKASLAAKGFTYTPSYPYFTNTNWGDGQNGANTMGAAFNYVLLASEPGGYAHNSQYARQLLFDSIDYLDDGRINDSVATGAVPALRAAGLITQSVADSFALYQGKELCTSCHGGGSGSQRPMASNAHPAHLTLPYGPGFYLGSDASSCQACHGTGSAGHLNGRIDVASGAGSACQGCHAGAAAQWQGSQPAARLSCTSCHAATPARLPNGVAAPYKGSFNTRGHGQYPASGSCTVCHDPDSRHISGSLGSYTRLRALNDNALCASCHNDTAVVRQSFRNMSTHATPEGRRLDCRECHDPHGSANLGMISGTVNGATIVFTDAVTGLVDPVGNRGLCQVCHTKTNHFRGGEPESSHFTTSCLGCHPHNSPGGAFRPIGGNCDSCHGYPPVPKSASFQVTFGVQGRWSSARFEDYSGGGGAHLVAGHVSPNAKASEGWANCTGCHNGGSQASAPYHKMAMPLKNHIDNVTVLVDPKLRFSDSFVIYSGAKLFNPPARNATGSCLNISCHMSPSARWSTER